MLECDGRIDLTISAANQRGTARRSATDADRDAMTGWLSKRYPTAEMIVAGPLEDAWWPR